MIFKRGSKIIVYLTWEFPCEHMLYYSNFFTLLQQKITSFEYLTIRMSQTGHRFAAQNRKRGYSLNYVETRGLNME